jgi:hypothetical protein
MAFATKQEQEVHLDGLVREKQGEHAILANLARKAEMAEERGDELEASRLKLEHKHHQEILKAVEHELAKASGGAKTRQSRASKRPSSKASQTRG